jgi:hypothetical protein
MNKRRKRKNKRNLNYRQQPIVSRFLCDEDLEYIWYQDQLDRLSRLYSEYKELEWRYEDQELRNAKEIRIENEINRVSRSMRSMGF